MAGATFVLADLIDLSADSDGFGGETLTAVSVVQSALTLVAGVLLLASLAGFYAQRFDEAGLLGLFGFVIALCGTLMAVEAFWIDAFIAPSSAREPLGFLDIRPPRALAAGFTLSYGSVTLGWLLFGLSLLPTGFYPRLMIVLLVIGAALTWVPIPLSGVPFSVAVVWMGCALSSKKDVSIGHREDVIVAKKCRKRSPAVKQRSR
jgi:hypothetical protein